MKICPKCGRDYVDELGFCLEDGTPLPAAPNKTSERITEDYGEQTFMRAPQTVAVAGAVRPAKSSSSFAVIIVLGLLLLGGVLVVGAGIAGFWYYASTRRAITEYDMTRSEQSNNRYPSNNDATRPPPISTSPGNFNVKRASNAPINSSDKPVPKQISGGVLNGKAISLPRPPYPPAAKAVRASGAVSVQVLVDEKGDVVSASAVSGHPLLRAAATSAAREAKFSPTFLSGQPVKVSGVITYNFVAP